MVTRPNSRVSQGNGVLENIHHCYCAITPQYSDVRHKPSNVKMRYPPSIKEVACLDNEKIFFIKQSW